MVSFLSNWIEEIAIAVIIASIFEMILPNGNAKKYIKIILGIYVVFSIISPFVDSKALYSLEIANTIEDYTSDVNASISSQKVEENLNQMYIDTFEKEITNMIEKNGYNVKSCTVNAVFDTESDEFGITNILIVLDSKNSDYILENNTKNNEVSNIEDIKDVKINIGNIQEQKNSSENITSNDIKELKQYLSDYYEIDKKIINIQV